MPWALTAEGVGDEELGVLAFGCLSPAHAGQFRAFVKQVRHAWDLEAILKGARRWPADPADRDVCYFLALSLRARLVKELPRERSGASPAGLELAHRAKGLLVELVPLPATFAR